MTTIVSQGTLQDVDFWKGLPFTGSVRMYGDHYQDYATLYRTQPNVRTVVDFMARNIAQLGLHVFRRVGENDRERLRDHGLAQLIKRPNFRTTRHRLMNSLMVDMGIYYNAYWLKVKASPGMALLRVPPQLVSVKGGLLPTEYAVNLSSKVLKVDPDQIVHFRGHNPDDPLTGLSPLETLRRILAEEQAAGDYREEFWQNAARMSVVVKRPAGAPPWDDPIRERFRADFEEMYSGTGTGGMTAILEEGMDISSMSFNAEQSEYVTSRKLTREEVARAYHVPLPMVGILDHATFSNIREQHKNLYQDSLGPWLSMLEEDIELQLFPEFDDMDDVYCEFNIAEKLQGSFEEQAEFLSKAIGRPWMKVNEGRARMNLPSEDGNADELAVPLNIDPTGGEMTQAVATVQNRTLARQRSIVEKRLGSGFGTVADAWDGERFDRELAADLANAGVMQPLILAQAINNGHRAQLAVALEGRTNGH